MTDGRRARYVPVKVTFAVEGTGPKLLRRFGVAGLATWVCVLAAAKRGRVEGTFSYVSEDGGWGELGLGFPNTPGFTLDEFFRYTGQLKKTRKRRDGEVKHIEITGWEHWNDTKRREADAVRKARKRAENTADIPGGLHGLSTTVSRTEVEVEVEAKGLFVARPAARQGPGEQPLVVDLREMPAA